MATVPSPVVICATGRWQDGSAASVPGPGRLLIVFVDGRQAIELPASIVEVPASPGNHMIRVEVMTSSHLEFQPPIAVDLRVRVSGSGGVLGTRCHS